MTAPEPPRLIIHAGFHKTGTKSVQRALQANRAVLSDYRILVKSDMPDVCAAALHYAQNGKDTALRRFAESLRAALPADPRVTVISAEDLIGLIPGRRGRQWYPAAGALLQVLGDVCDGMRAHLYFSTRATGPWLKSLYAHNLRHGTVTQSFAAYKADHTGLAGLDHVLRDITANLTGIPVSHCSLETLAAAPHGPLSPLLDVMQVPAGVRARLAPCPVANSSLPDHILDGFLHLNQSGLDKTMLEARKRDLIHSHRRSVT